jgi:hypothetical protein
VCEGAQTELASYRVDCQASVRACLTDRNFLTSGMTLISRSCWTVDREIKHCSGRRKNVVARNQDGRDFVLFGIFRLPRETRDLLHHMISAITCSLNTVWHVRDISEHSATVLESHGRKTGRLGEGGFQKWAGSFSEFSFLLARTRAEETDAPLRLSSPSGPVRFTVALNGKHAA